MDGGDSHGGRRDDRDLHNSVDQPSQLEAVTARLVFATPPPFPGLDRLGKDIKNL